VRTGRGQRQAAVSGEMTWRTSRFAARLRKLMAHAAEPQRTG
jgi:hypothetical protein